LRQLIIEQEQTYAAVILRLLLDGVLEPEERENIIWGDLLQIAAQNGVLIRVVEQLEKIGIEPLHFFSLSAREMLARNRQNLALIARIGRRCSESNVDFIFAKAIQNYPDMTGDIDLYVVPHSLDVDVLILKGMPATPIRRNLRNRIDGTANYRLAICDSMLEIHHGRVGMLGEHKLYIRQVIDNARYVRVEGAQFLTPSPEDQLVWQALQRVVQRSYLRLSDVVSTFALLRREPLDWNYIIKTVKDLNIFFGLSCYLSFAEQIYRQTFKSNLLPPHLLRSLVPNPEPIGFRDGFYRFPRISLASRGYADKFWSAVRSENWSVASRLSLLPVVALTTIVRKLRTSRRPVHQSHV